MLSAKTVEGLERPAVRTTVESPVGRLTLVATDDGLRALLFAGDAKRYRRELAKLEEDSAHPVLAAAAGQLDEYFSGARRRFDLPLALQGTGFQKQVWRELTRIPYGKTRSYGEIAERLGSPGSCRAVGAANGRNPVAVVVPCHRVIGADGSLTGFGGGLDRKEYLLDLESR